MNWDSLPEGWKVKLLGRVASLVMGQSPPSSSYNVHGKGLPFFQGKAEFGDLYPVPTKWCSSPVRIAEEDDVLLSVRAPVGPVNLSPSKCCIGRGLCAIRGHPNVITQKYLFYYLRSIESRIAEKSSGSTFTAITKPDIERLPIPLPPLEEQRRIVEILEQADELRRKKKAALVLVDKIIRSLFLDMFGDPATNPKGWEVRKLEEAIAVAQTGFAYGKWREANGVPQLRPFNITSEGKVDLSTLKYVPEDMPFIGRYLLQLDDIVFNNTNSPELVGKAAVFRSQLKCVFSNHLTRIRLNPNVAMPDYVALMLNFLWRNGFFRDRCQQWVNQAAINVDRLKAIEIPLPPLHLQQRFAELVSHFEEKRRQMEQAAEALEKLYRTLLKKAFTGELTKTWREANGIRWELPQLTERQKLLLGVLYYHNTVRKVAPPVTVVMKNMFLLQEEQKVPLGYRFVPYKYGPFSKEVYEDLEVLEKEMLVIRSKRSKIVERQETAIDEEAVDEVKQILETLPQDKRQALDEVMKRYASMGFEQLLGYVYTKYPQFTIESTRRRTQTQKVDVKGEQRS
jgi:type I restriction enzyme S subunit